MRYPDDIGYVWNTIAQLRDVASSHLAGRARTYVAYPHLTGKPSYIPKYLQPVQLNCYDTSPAGLQALEAFIRQNNIRVVVFMSALPQTVNLALLRRLGVRTVNTENDSFDHRRRDSMLKRGAKFLVRRVFRRQLHDLHLANSRSQRDFLLNYAMLPPARVALMENSVDCERFCPGDRTSAREQTGLDQDRFWILCVAQARPEKRIDAIIRMAQAVVHARPDAKLGFVYVGDGAPAAQWKALVDELGLNGVFRFAGACNNVVPYYHAANLMVHAAERESFGLAIVEAMACAVPVIASAAAGPKETILDGKTGALVELNDFATFTQRILRYIDDPSLTELHGNNARQHVVAAYNVARQGKDFATHIAKFL
jgi:glycosyltransferase involved in cell wall biosynthesis